MSISVFSDAQKNAFMALVRKMIFADDLVDFAESEAFIKLKERLGISEFEDVGEDLEKLLSNFDLEIEKTAVIEELLTISNIDHEYSDEERAFIKKISGLMGVDEKTVEELEKRAGG
ncbi:MAG: hypothetical protein GY859_10405 [Desulfobacterales bacterium]|nr:hypothetical protein [Desulfobacterales bacterium]